eukprot:scaffold1231_cov187-Pinguiococcus_pyrenoidosus.AAC.19
MHTKKKLLVVKRLSVRRDRPKWQQMEYCTADVDGDAARVLIDWAVDGDGNILALMGMSPASTRQFISVYLLSPRGDIQTLFHERAVNALGYTVLPTAITIDAFGDVILADVVMNDVQNGGRVRRIEARLKPLSRLRKVTLNDCLEDMLRDGHHSDVVFAVSGEEIAAHQVVLRSRSEYFAAMFRTEFVEKATGRVEIDDFSAEVFRTLLHYLYTDRFDVKNDTLLPELYVMALRYHLPELQQLCIRRWIRCFDDDSALELLVFAERYEVAILKDTIKKRILSCPEAFLEQRKEALEAFRKQNMDLCQELLMDCLGALRDARMQRNDDMNQF